MPYFIGTILILLTVAQLQAQALVKDGTMDAPEAQAKLRSIKLDSVNYPEKTFMMTELMPEFSKEKKERAEEYIIRHMKVPAQLKEEGIIPGRIFMKLLINEQGRVIEVILLKGSKSEALDTEVMQTALHMPLWKPAMQNGQRVACYYNLVIGIEWK